MATNTWLAAPLPSVIDLRLQEHPALGEMTQELTASAQGCSFRTYLPAPSSIHKKRNIKLPIYTLMLNIIILLRKTATLSQRMVIECVRSCCVFNIVLCTVLYCTVLYYALYYALYNVLHSTLVYTSARSAEKILRFLPSKS